MISVNRGKLAYKSDALTVAQVYDLVKQYDKDYKPGREVNPVLSSHEEKKGTQKRNARPYTRSTDSRTASPFTSQSFS